MTTQDKIYILEKWLFELFLRKNKTNCYIKNRRASNYMDTWKDDLQ